MYERSIELLNAAIADEIAAIHQYMYFHFRLDDLGYAPLANFLAEIFQFAPRLTAPAAVVQRYRVDVREARVVRRQPGRRGELLQ